MRLGGVIFALCLSGCAATLDSWMGADMGPALKTADKKYLDPRGCYSDLTRHGLEVSGEACPPLAEVEEATEYFLRYSMIPPEYLHNLTVFFVKQQVRESGEAYSMDFYDHAKLDDKGFPTGRDYVVVGAVGRQHSWDGWGWVFRHELGHAAFRRIYGPVCDDKSWDQKRSHKCQRRYARRFFRASLVGGVW